MLVLSTTVDVYCQEQAPFPFREYYGADTRTNVADDNTRDGFGWAVSMVSEADTGIFRIAIETGLVRTTQHKEFGESTKFSSESDLDLRFNSITVGLLGRQYLSRRKVRFFELGLFLGIPVTASKVSTFRSFLPQRVNDSTWVFKRTERREKSRGYGIVNYGPQVGFAWGIPIGSSTMMLRATYRYGLVKYEEFSHRDFSIQNQYFLVHIGVLLAARSEMVNQRK